jgi:nitrogen fixation NifU-like protein
MELDFSGNRLEAIGVRGRGCSISQASASMMSDLVEGKSIEEIRHLNSRFADMMRSPEAEVPEELGDLEALQGVAKFAVRVKCATLAWHTLEDGLEQHEKGDGVVRREET